MIFEGEFFSGEHLRWNLGWPTPNYAGAFLVTLLALLWMFSASRWRWGFLVVEAGGLFLLAKTYSRGAVVAWGVAWLFGVVAARGWRLQAGRWVWVARIVVLALMMLVVGFGWSRAADDRTGTIPGTPASEGLAEVKSAQVEKDSSGLTMEDGSVVNRLALWQGGLQMIAVAPLNGWGAGESGRAYMNWYQDLDRDEGYSTMVNSYLHVAVERGLPVLAVVLWLCAWWLLLAWSGARNAASRHNGALGMTRPALMMAAGASLVAWLVANVFTTLWIEPELWIVPVVAVFVVVWRAGHNSGCRLISLIAVSLIIAICTVGGLYGVGRWLLGKASFVFKPGVNGSVMLVTAAPVRAIWRVWSDPSVLGPAPGRELRRWLETAPAEVGLVVHRAAPLEPEEIPTEAAGVQLFGRQAERIGRDFPLACRELWLIHPTVSPSAVRRPNPSVQLVTVVLPQIDEVGNGPAWRQWAKANGARVIESPSCGQDIRVIWPGILPLTLNSTSVKGAAKVFSPLSRDSS